MAIDDRTDTRPRHPTNIGASIRAATNGVDLAMIAAEAKRTGGVMSIAHATTTAAWHETTSRRLPTLAGCRERTILLTGGIAMTINGPRPADDPSDRFLKCEEDLEDEFQALIWRAIKAGWDEAEACVAIASLADHHALAMMSNAEVDRQIADGQAAGFMLRFGP